MANHFKLHTDNPIKNSEYDGLGFEKYSDVLSKVIKNTDTPFTIGIFGEWGKGKTSLMHLTKEKVEGEKNFTVFFNAWQYEKEEHPIVALIVAIEQALEENKSKLEKVLDGFEKGVDDVYSLMKYSIYALSTVKFKGSFMGNEMEIDIDPTKPIEKFEEKLKEDKNKHILNKLINESNYLKVFEALEMLSSILEGKDIKIVVFIDDLDRCLPDNAVKLLESIKLILDLKGFMFVLGVAREVIEGHLKHKYETKFGIKDGNHGQLYLDKIIQLPFYLPNHSSKMKNISNALYKKLGNDISVEDKLLEVLEQIAVLDIVSPRFLVRLINRIKVSIEIIKEDENEHQKLLEVFSVSCTLEELYKKEYILLSKNPQKAKYISEKLTNKEFDKEKNINLFSSEEIERLEEIISKDDGVIKNILQTDAGKKWLSEDNHRKISFEFLKSSSQVDYEQIEYHTDLVKRDSEAKQKVIDGKIEIKSYQDSFVKIPNKDYEFSKYLVTNAWYEEFIKANGYKEDKYWKTKEAKEFKDSVTKYNSLDELYLEMCSRDNIKEWYKDIYKKDIKKELFSNPLQPIVYVSYYEAEAFCEYLNSLEKNKDYIYSLPTKEEFEYIGSGGDKNNLYPWGSEWNDKFCNNYNTKISTTSIVGVFAEGKSKFEVFDMSGNVWKWTKTKKDDKYNYIVGGSWSSSVEDNFRVSSSIVDRPDYRDDGIGFHLTRTKGNTL